MDAPAVVTEPPLKRPRLRRGPVGSQSLAEWRALLNAVIDNPAELVERLISWILLPDFEPPGHGYGSQKRMDHAREQALFQLLLFQRLGRFDVQDPKEVMALPRLDRVIRSILSMPRLRTLLYKAWLGRARRGMWNPHQREAGTETVVTEIPPLQSFMVASDQPRVVLNQRWYGVFIADAYGNDHLGWVTRTLWRVTLRAKVRGAPGYWDQFMVTISRWENYGVLMHYRHPGTGTADRERTLAPGVYRMMRNDRWTVLLRDTPQDVEFPGSELLPSMRQAEEQPPYYRILRSVKRALAACTIIRVPTLVTSLFHHRFWSEPLGPSVSDPMRPLYPYEAAVSRRAGVTVLAAHGNPFVVPQGRRRFLVFDPPIHSVSPQRIARLLPSERITRFDAGSFPQRMERSLVLRNVHLVDMPRVNGVISDLFAAARLPPMAAIDVGNVYQPARFMINVRSITVRVPSGEEPGPRQKGVPIPWPWAMQTQFLLTVPPRDAALIANPGTRGQQVEWFQKIGGGARYGEGEQYINQELLMVVRDPETGKPRLLARKVSFRGGPEQI